MSARAELLGSPYKPLGVVGSVGVDHHARGSLPNEQYKPESKTPVSFDTIPAVADQFNLRPIGTFAAQTGTNFAAGAEALNREGYGGRVIFFAPFAPEAPHAEIISQALDKVGVDFRPTKYNGRNPEALLVSNGDKKALVAKPDETPPITDFDPQVNALVLASLGGKWEETYNNALDFAEGALPLGLLGSESQIKKLPDNIDKKDAYMRVLTEGKIFLANDDEVRILVGMDDQAPDEDPAKLIHQMRKVSGDGIISATFGKDGALLLDEEDTLHALRVTSMDKAKIVSTVGAGDETAAATYQGLRQEKPVEEVMVNAALGARGVIVVLDSLSGQMKAADWKQGTTAAQVGFNYETYTRKDLAKRPIHIFGSQK
jgi:sugar/nucleoside kinase (ribokinase family)